MTFTFEDGKWVDGKFETINVAAGIGTTLRVYQDYVRVMSDVWDTTTFATFWNEDKQCVETRSWVKDSKVDATPEAKAKARQWFFDRAFERFEREATEKVQEIVKGARVKVTRGRRDKGVEGIVAVMIQRPYTYGYKSVMATKLGVATSDEMVEVAGRNGKVYKNYKDVTWVWARNCDLVEVPAVDLEEVKRRAENAAEDEMRKFA